MALAVTQSDFRNHIKHYLDLVNDDGENIYIARTKQRSAVIIDQNKLDWLERYVKTDQDSLEHAVAEDKLKEYGIIPDKDPVPDGQDYDNFWKQFEK